MKTKEKIIKNTFFNGLTSFSNMLIYFLLMPFIVSKLGITLFGIYILTTSLVNYGVMFELGASSALVKFVAKYKAEGDDENIKRVISTIFVFYLGIGLLSATVIFIIGSLLLNNFNIPREYQSLTKDIMYILAIGSFLTWPLSTFRNVLAGLQRYEIIAQIGLLSSMITGIATIILLLSGRGLLEIVIVETIIKVANLIFLAIIAFYLLGYNPVKLGKIKRESATTLLGFSLLVYLIRFADQISYRSDTIVIGLFLPVGAIAIFEGANKIQGFVRKVFLVSNSAILPAASELHAKNSSESIKKLLLSGSRYVGAVTLSIALPLFLLSKWLLVAWLGPTFEQSSILAQVFLSFWFFNALTGLSGTLLIGIGKVKSYSKLVVIKSLLNLVLSVALVRYLGILGVILGTVLSEVLFFPALINYTLREVGESWRTYFDEVILKILKPLIFPLFALLLLLRFNEPSNLIQVSYYGLISVSVYSLTFYLMSMTTDEKYDFKLTFRKRFIRDFN